MIKSCLRCAREYLQTSNRQKVCAECKPSYRKETYIYEKPVKQTEYINCERCGACTPKHSRKRFCSNCAKVRATEHWKRLQKERPELGLMRTKKHYLANRSAVLVRKREWYRRNKESVDRYNQLPETRARKRAWETERMKDPSFALSKRISHGMRLALKANKGGRHWESVVGYSLSDLMCHLERQFVKGMSWSNMDQWHVDHIVPLVSFKFQSVDDSQFRAAWAITNLRPLWDVENCRKGGQRLHLI